MKQTGWSKGIWFSLFSLLALFTLGSGTASAKGGIHSIDFRNFTYPAYCVSERPHMYRVRNGIYSYSKGYDQVYFDVTKPEFGDVNGDGQDEAIIRGTCSTGGTGNFTEGFIYTMRQGKPVLLTHIPGGDRAEGGLHHLSISNGLVVVESYANKDTGGLCCPDFIDTQHYKWDGHKLVATGKKERRDYVEPNQGAGQG